MAHLQFGSSWKRQKELFTVIFVAGNIQVQVQRGPWKLTWVEHIPLNGTELRGKSLWKHREWRHTYTTNRNDVISLVSHSSHKRFLPNSGLGPLGGLVLPFVSIHVKSVSCSCKKFNFLQFEKLWISCNFKMIVWDILNLLHFAM